MNNNNNNKARKKMYLGVESSNNKEFGAVFVRSHEQQRLDSIERKSMSNNNNNNTVLICQTPIVNHEMVRTMMQFQSIPSCKHVAQLPIVTTQNSKNMNNRTECAMEEQPISMNPQQQVNTVPETFGTGRFVAALRTNPGIFSKQIYLQQDTNEELQRKSSSSMQKDSQDITIISSDTDDDDDVDNEKFQAEDSTEIVTSSDGDDDEHLCSADEKSECEEEDSPRDEEDKRVQLERDRCMEVYKQSKDDERAQVIRSITEGLISMIDNSISVACFESDDLPAITMYDYVERLVRYVDAWAKDTASPHSTGIRAALFAIRYLKKFKPGISIRSIHRLYMCAVLAGLKSIEDFRMRNGYWCKVGGVELQELNRMEIEFCERMNWELQLSLGEYETQKRHFVDPHF